MNRFMPLNFSHLYNVSAFFIAFCLLRRYFWLIDDFSTFFASSVANNETISYTNWTPIFRNNSSLPLSVLLPTAIGY